MLYSLFKDFFFKIPIKVSSDSILLSIAKCLADSLLLKFGMLRKNLKRVISSVLQLMISAFTQFDHLKEQHK